MSDKTEKKQDTKKRLAEHRYELNPFITTVGSGSEDSTTKKEVMHVTPRVKSRVVKTVASADGSPSKEFILTENGDAVTKTFVEQSVVEDTQFLKIYSRYITLWLNSLSGTAQRVLCIILREYQESGINNDRIYLNVKIAEDHDKYFLEAERIRKESLDRKNKDKPNRRNRKKPQSEKKPLKPIGRSTYQKGLQELTDADIIAPNALGRGWYWINPNYFFNGNRIAFAQVVKRRNKEDDPNQLHLPISKE